MIANDPRRSFEFFTAPLASGKASIEQPLDRNQIIAMHAVRGALSALAFTLAALALGTTTQTITTTEDMVADVMEMMFASPLRIAIINWLGGLLFVSLFWVVGRNFNQDRNWFQVQSGLTRYLLVIALINFDFALAIYLISFVSTSLAGIIVLLQSLFGFYSLVNLGWVVQGVFDLANAGIAYLVVLLTVLALVGASTLIGLLSMGFI